MFYLQTVLRIVMFAIFVPNMLAYCGEKYCSGNKQHTLCKYKIDGPSLSCKGYVRLISTQDEKISLLEKLNKRRHMIASGDVRSFPKAANMRKLIWNEELSLSAQRWADQCTKHEVPDVHDECRDLEHIQVGQNIATVVGDAPGLTPAALVDVWYMQLIDMNATIIANYHSVSSTSNYEYFTQLIWADTSEVGCGGVKFRENYNDKGKEISRTVHRVVCNFALKGNIVGQAVYTEGAPCTRCPDNITCDLKFNALCNTSIESIVLSMNNGYASHKNSLNGQPSSHLPDLLAKDGDPVEHRNYPHLFGTDPNIETIFESNNYTHFDLLSQIFEVPKNKSIKTLQKASSCKNKLAIDDLLNFLKNKLSDDIMLKHMLATDKQTDITFPDIEVDDFMKKLYKSKFTTTTKAVTENNNLNSTLLVNLVEAVIFRNTAQYSSEEKMETTDIPTQIIPVKIKQVQPEISPVTQYNKFDGHYFFPEEDEDESEDTNSNERTESYYEANSNIQSSDILSEINNIKRKPESRHFLDDILEAEDDLDSTTTTTLHFISPDNMGLVKDGYNNMKRFLEEIGEKRENKLFGKNA